MVFNAVSDCLGLVFLRAVIRATRCCLTAPPYTVFLIVTHCYILWANKWWWWWWWSEITDQKRDASGASTSLTSGWVAYCKTVWKPC